MITVIMYLYIMFNHLVMKKVRLKWLRGRVDEDDGESDGETAALRESLQVVLAQKSIQACLRNMSNKLTKIHLICLLELWLGQPSGFGLNLLSSLQLFRSVFKLFKPGRLDSLVLYPQQLSNASSPAESVVSTSSNPGHSLGSSGASSRSVQP